MGISLTKYVWYLTNYWFLGCFLVRVFETQDRRINIAPEVGGARPQIRQEAFDIP